MARLAVLAALLLANACTSYQQAEKALPSWPRVSVAGGELEYSVTGVGEPLLLIHGSGYADAFGGLQTHPALSNYQMIVYHRRGHGGSSRATSPFTIEQQAADALKLLDDLRIRRAHVLGHSYGGSVALEMAKQAPDRIATLSLFEAAVPSLGTVDPKLMQALTEALALYQAGDRRSALKTFGEAVAPGSWDAMHAAGMTAMIDQAVVDLPTFFDVEMPALQQWQYSAADLANLRVPALVVRGELTPTGFVAGHQALMKNIAGADEVIVRGVGHELQQKDPKAVGAAVAAFLAKHPLK